MLTELWVVCARVARDDDDADDDDDGDDDDGLSKWLEHHQNSSGKNLSSWWAFSRWQMQDF